MAKTDYWSKLKLNECWSEKERYNKIMNHILGDEEESTDEPIIEEPIIENTSNINVTVTDEEGNPIKDADVSVYSNGEPFESTTDSAGECVIHNVPFGDYTIEAVAEGYDFTVEEISVNQEEQSRTIILKSEVDDNI